jgi:hypothetical protein
VRDDSASYKLVVHELGQDELGGEV